MSIKMMKLNEDPSYNYTAFYKGICTLFSGLDFQVNITEEDNEDGNTPTELRILILDDEVNESLHDTLLSSGFIWHYDKDHHPVIELSSGVQYCTLKNWLSTRGIVLSFLNY